MANLQGLFCDHPHSVGETYVQHMHSAAYFGTRMIAAGLCCCIHGIFPFLFVKTGSKTVAHLNDVMIRSRVRNARQGAFVEIGANI